MGEPNTIPAVVSAAGERWPEATALRAGATSWTFADLACEVDRVAAALGASGIEPGDRVGIWAPNSPEWVLASLGVARAGAVLVPINTRAKGREAADALGRAKCRMLLTVSTFLGTDYVAMLRATDTPLPELRETIALDDVGHAHAIAWSELLARSRGGRSAGAIAPETISHIQFTSGTTGRPKGAMLRHLAMCGTTRDWCATVGLRPGDRYLIVSPMFHISGHKTGVLACLTAGATILPQPTFDPVDVMRRVQDEQITVLPGPPTIYQTLLEHPRRAEFDLGSLRLAVTGAASIPPVLIGRMRRELGFSTVITAYGTTETTGVVTMCRPGDDERTIAETSGRAVSGVEVRIAEGSNEILVRGYNVMAGYLDDPEATAAAVDCDGWFHTGDVGALDAPGNLRITDRLTDVFHVGGFNAYPAEIEATLLRHPAIAQAAVIGVPDPRLGEVGHAFVVARQGAVVDVEQLLRWCRDELANFKVPRGVTIVDELPLNASGKVVKFELRSLKQNVE